MKKGNTKCFKDQGKECCKNYSHGFYESDLENLAGISKITGQNRSAALRSCIPDQGMVKVFEHIERLNRGLTWNAFVAQVLGQWMINNAPKITLEDMLQGLRAHDQHDRAKAAKLLKYSTSRGLELVGEDPLDIEMGVGKDLHKLIDDAADGNTNACDQLEKILTNLAPLDPADVVKKETVDKTVKAGRKRNSCYGN